MIKKFTIMMLILSTVLIQITAMGITTSTVFVDISTDTVTISGVTQSGLSGKTVTLLVFNPGKGLGDLPDDLVAIQKQGEKQTGTGGGFSFHFPITYTGVEGTGIYKVYIGGDDYSQNEQLSFYFAIPQDRKAAVDAINSTTSSSNMFDKLNMYADVLSLHFPVFDGINKEALAQKLFERVKTQAFNSNSTGEIQTWIRANSIVDAYNQSRSDLVYKTDGEILYPEVVAFNTLDTTRNLNVYQAYLTGIKKAGLDEIRQSLLGKNCVDIAALQLEFIQQVVINGIKNSINSGYGHVNSLLTQNAIAAGIDLSRYNTLSDKGAVDSKLVSSSFSTIAELNARINEIIIGLGDNGGTVGITKPSSGGGFTTVGDTILPSPTPTISPVFNDISNVEWAVPAVKDLVEKGIVKGMGDGSFQPDLPVTREQFAKMLALAIKLDVSDANSGFGDVADTEWYATYITALKKANIVKGDVSGEFGVGKNITRQDMAVMVHRAITTVGIDIKATSQEVSFEDDRDISSYAREAVGFLTSSGIINGMGDGLFSPYGICTRAQAAKIIYGIIK